MIPTVTSGSRVRRAASHWRVLDFPWPGSPVTRAKPPWVAGPSSRGAEGSAPGRGQGAGAGAPGQGGKAPGGRGPPEPVREGLRPGQRPEGRGGERGQERVPLEPVET